MPISTSNVSARKEWYKTHQRRIVPLILKGCLVQDFTKVTVIDANELDSFNC